MADIAYHAGIAELRRHSRAATTEPDWLRIAMIAGVFGMLVLVLFAPLVAVFTQALAKGVGEAVASFANPDVLSAIRLTLVVAAVALRLPCTCAPPRRRRRLTPAYPGRGTTWRGAPGARSPLQGLAQHLAVALALPGRHLPCMGHL